MDDGQSVVPCSVDVVVDLAGADSLRACACLASWIVGVFFSSTSCREDTFNYGRQKSLLERVKEYFIFESIVID